MPAKRLTLPSHTRLAAGYELLIESLPDPVFVKDRAHRWVLLNAACCAFFGLPREHLLGHSDYDFSPAAEAKVFWDIDDLVFNTGQTHTNLEHHTDAQGKRRVIETRKSLFMLGDEPYLVGIIRDLTVMTEIQAELARSNRSLEQRIQERTEELKQSNAQLHSIAFFDPLTSLPNRRLLVSSVERRLNLGPLAVFYVDVDNFKWVNDSQGHPFGDALLVELAARLRALTCFSLVARVGGDEFVALSHESDQLDKIALAHVCRELLRTASLPVTIQGCEVSASVSVGVAVAPDDGSSVNELLQNADSAMYRAKERGRNQYAFFVRQQGNRAREQVSLERGLRRALRGQEISVAFQPIVDARSGVVQGVEALARWADLELGQVSPERFVPVAEACGLIHELSHYILRRALHLAKLHLPPSQRLCVNLSALQLDRLTLVEDVRRALQECDFPAARLELEITESIAANKSDRLLNVLNSLRELGVSFSLDDFGTGYSALGHLQRLPIDRVKIDKSFVAEIETSKRARALIEAVIRMTHALELKTIAEGVERPGQRDLLVQLGCDELQGYLLGRPGELATRR